MAESEFQIIEKQLALPLAKSSRATFNNYPFSSDSLGTEGLLPDSSDAVIEPNFLGQCILMASA